MSHGTMWEDGGDVGLTCDGLDADTLTADGEWHQCPACKKMVKLEWNVKILEETSERR